MRPDRLLIAVLRRLPPGINPVSRVFRQALAPLAGQIERLRPHERAALDRFLDASVPGEASPLFGLVRTLADEGVDAIDVDPLLDLASETYVRSLLLIGLLGLIVLPVVFLHEIEGAFDRHLAGGPSRTLAMGAVALVSTLGIVLVVIAVRRVARWARDLSSPTGLRILVAALGAMDLVRSSPLRDGERRRLIASIEEIRFLLTHQLPFHVSGPSRSAKALAMTHGWRAADHLSEVANAAALPSATTWAFVEEEMGWLFLACADRNWGVLRLSPRVPESMAGRWTAKRIATTLLVGALPPLFAFGLGAVVPYPLQDKAQIVSVLWSLFTLWRALDPNLRETLDAVRDGAKLIGYVADKKG